MTDHILKKIDAEITSLRGRLLSMAELVKEQLSDATTLVSKCYLERGVSTDKLEERVNELQAVVDRESIQFIALHKPSAGDLRAVLAIMRIEADLEAIGNASTQIARAGERIHKGSRRDIPNIEQLVRIFDLTRAMLVSAIDSFARADATNLLGTARNLASLREDAADFRQNTIAAMIEDSSNVVVQVESLEIIRMAERIAEFARSIASHATFMVIGADLRNAGTQDIEKALSESRH
jgi:phosphate transport system protein